MEYRIPIRDEQEIPKFNNDTDFKRFVLVNSKNLKTLTRTIEAITLEKRQKLFFYLTEEGDVAILREVLAIIGGVESLNVNHFEQMLYRACYKNNMEVLHFYFDELGFKVDKPFHNCEYIVHEICGCNKLVALRYIFSKGADPNLMKGEYHPLASLIENCGMIDSLNEFIIAGANLGVRYQNMSLYEFSTLRREPDSIAVFFNLGLADDHAPQEFFLEYDYAETLLKANLIVNNGDENEMKSGLRKKGADDRYLKFFFTGNAEMKADLTAKFRTIATKKFIAAESIDDIFREVGW